MTFNVDKLLQQIRKCELPSQSIIKKLCKKVIEIFFQQSNVQPVNAPVIVVGDVHGQFFDVLNLLEIGKEPPQSNYIMIGDFVDRGYHSVQTMTLLFCLKLKYPENVTLLRGNHQCKEVTVHYGFFDQIKRKYGNTKVWEFFTQAFNYLPVGAVIQGKILCIHGGLSPTIKTIDQIRAINRKIQISQNTSLCDLMWSDPSKDVQDWDINKRGAGYYFGEKVVKNFNHINNLILIARAHQLVQEGFEYWFDKSLVTVWSAPNYCYRAGNKASIMKVTQELQNEFSVFNSVPQSDHSEMRPELMPYFL